MTTGSMTAGNTVLERFADVSPENFKEEIEKLWKGTLAVRNTVIDQVTNGNLPVMTGLSIIACATGQTYGYDYFHGRPAPADLLASIANGDQSGQRQGGTSGGRPRS